MVLFMRNLGVKNMLLKCSQGKLGYDIISKFNALQTEIFMCDISIHRCYNTPNYSKSN